MLVIVLRNGNELFYTKNGFFFKGNIFQEFVLRRKIVMSVIACDTSSELITAYTVLLSIC